MSLGAKLCLDSGESRDLFKDAINRNTTAGSHIDSGDHLRSSIDPMCEYDTKSVINVLSQELLTKDDVAFSGVKTSKRIEYFKEEWI